jgi:sugar phosphate isomerase/epimerase
MSGQDSPLSSIPFSIATVSVGYSSTPLHSKLYAIAQAGFTGIELAFEDLVSFANIHLLRDVDEDDYDSLYEAAIEVHNLCVAQKLEIVILQPFSNFEGWPEHSDERMAAFKKARGWIKIMKGLETNMLQVGSNDAPIPPLSRSRADAVRDLKGLADMLAEEGFKLAYEPRCWATVSSTWKDGWEVVKAVDRTNCGLCLDTFQITASEYADPTTANGLHGGIPPGELGKNFGDSLYEMATTVPAEKVYLLQISDAWRPKVPLSAEMDVKDVKLKKWWSSNYRPLPFEGGYFPVIELARKVLDTGARSWWSIESFDGGRDGKENREPDLEMFSKKAFASLTRLREECLHYGE